MQRRNVNSSPFIEQSIGSATIKVPLLHVTRHLLYLLEAILTRNAFLQFNEACIDEAITEQAKCVAVFSH